MAAAVVEAMAAGRVASDATIELSHPAEHSVGPAEGKEVKRASALKVLFSLLALQTVSAFFFLGELWTEVLGLRTTPVPYEWQEYIQILASIGLVSGVIVTFAFIRRTQTDMARLQRQIDVASGNYETHLLDLFEQWGLSDSERAVTIYVMKGFSNAEVAELRGTTAATVKSQLNAVYRKSGCANRQQLISYLVEDLLSGLVVS